MSVDSPPVVDTVATLFGRRSKLIGDSVRVLETDQVYIWDGDSWVLPDEFKLTGVINVSTDLDLANRRWDYHGQTAVTGGASTELDGNGAAWFADTASVLSPGADVIQVAGQSIGRWRRITGLGGGGTGTGDWTGPASGNTVVGIRGVPVDSSAATPSDGDLMTYSTSTGGWVPRPFPLGDIFVYNVQDYGATGDGTTDDLAAIHATIAAAINDVGVYGDPLYRIGKAAIYFPFTSNWYRISDTILVQNCKHLRFITDSNGNARIRSYFTASGKPMIRMDGTDDVHWTGFEIARGGGTFAPQSGFEFIEATTVGEYETTNCHIKECVFSTGSVQFTYCFDFQTNSGRHTADKSYVYGYSVAGVRIANGSYCYFESCPLIGILQSDTYGIYCPSSGGGSFTWEGSGGGGGYHFGTNGCDFMIESHDGVCSINTWNMERSTRVLTVGTTASDNVGHPISIRNSRLTCDTYLAADGRAFVLHDNTPVTIDGNTTLGFGAGEPARIYMDTTHASPSLNLGSNSWDCTPRTAYGWTPAASGSGTIWYGVLEYPNTWTAPPVVPVANQRIALLAGGNDIQRMPTTAAVVGLGDGDAPGSSAYNFTGSSTFNSGASQTQVINLSATETNNLYRIFPSIEIVSGTPPDGFSVQVTAKAGTSSTASGSFTVRFSHAITFSFKLNWMLVR